MSAYDGDDDASDDGGEKCLPVLFGGGVCAYDSDDDASGDGGEKRLPVLSGERSRGRGGGRDDGRGGPPPLQSSPWFLAKFSSPLSDEGGKKA